MSSRNLPYDYAWLQRAGQFEQFQHRSDNKLSPKAGSLYLDKSLPLKTYNPYGPYSNSQRTVATSNFYNPKDKHKYNDTQLGSSSWPLREHVHDASRPQHYLKHHPIENTRFIHSSSYFNFQNSLNLFPDEGRSHQNQLRNPCTLNDQQVVGGCYGDNGLMFNKESCVAIDVNAKQSLSNQQQNIHFENNNTTMQVSSLHSMHQDISRHHITTGLSYSELKNKRSFTPTHSKKTYSHREKFTDIENKNNTSSLLRKVLTHTSSSDSGLLTGKDQDYTKNNSVDSISSNAINSQGLAKPGNSYNKQAPTKENNHSCTLRGNESLKINIDDQKIER